MCSVNGVMLSDSGSDRNDGKVRLQRVSLAYETYFRMPKLLQRLSYQQLVSHRPKYCLKLGRQYLHGTSVVHLPQYNGLKLNPPSREMVLRFPVKAIQCCIDLV